MGSPNVLVVRVDPMDRTTGLLVPVVAQRIRETADQHFDELDPDLFTSGMMARLWAGDDTVLVLALVEEGTFRIVGHAVAEIAKHGKNTWVFVSQTKADQNVGDAIKRAILLADEWGKTHKATRMVMATSRSDTAWRRRYGFSALRHLMSRDIGAPLPSETGSDER